MSERRFPILRAGTVPWSAAERAYKGYVAAGHGGQSLERVAERGGFSAGEFAVMYQGYKYNDRRFDDRWIPCVIATAIELGHEWDVGMVAWLQERKQ